MVFFLERIAPQLAGGMFPPQRVSISLSIPKHLGVEKGTNLYAESMIRGTGFL